VIAAGEVAGQGRADRPALTGRKRGQRGLPMVILALLAGAGLIACGRSGNLEPATGVDPVAQAVSPQPPVSTSADAAVGLPRSTPVRVTIPKIDADSSLVPLGLERDGTLQVPSVNEPRQAGWFTGAPTPGEVGPAVIAGHVDGRKMKGIFFRLHELAAGDVVLVGRADGTTATFVVSERQQIAKSRFPTERVYGDTPGPELRLITCGGAFDRPNRNYLDNVIVYAKLKL
jgi:sortase (surface protein transpeptidase)